MTPPFDPAVPLVPKGAVPAEQHRALALAAVAVTREGLARFRLTGTGRVACLQGLVTCDVEEPGDGAHLFGALLTPKGAIVAPLWIIRLGDAIALELPAAAAEATRPVLARSLPPRLCRAEEITAVTGSARSTVTRIWLRSSSAQAERSSVNCRSPGARAP